MPAKRAAKPIGLAIVGAGRIGLIRAEIAAKHPNVGWIGLAEIRANRGNEVAERVRADFWTADYRDLLARPEVTAAVIATDEHLHVDPILAAVERGLPLLIEKPLATELAESEQVLRAIQKSGVTRSSVIRNDSAGAGSQRRKRSGPASLGKSPWSLPAHS